MADLRKNYKTGVDAGLIQIEDVPANPNKGFYTMDKRRAFAQSLKDRGIV